MSKPYRAFHSEQAPAAIGAYSQATAFRDIAFLSGQIPLDPATMELVSDDIEAQIAQVFDNLTAVAAAAGGSLDDILKLTVYLIDLGDFARVNEAMEARFSAPLPARAAIGVAALPRGAKVEIEGIMALS